MKALKADLPTFASLRDRARVYVVAVVVAGAACLIAAAGQMRLEDHAGLFAVLLVLAVAISAMKIELPLGRSHSNL